MVAAWLLLLIVGGSAAADPAGSPVPRELLTPEHKARLAAEIEKAGPNHPWAGGYYEGDGLGTNASLIISPTGEYSFENWGCLGLYGLDSGMIQERDGIIRFAGAQSNELSDKAFHVVPWGERVYLLAADELMSFVNKVNQGWEPRYGSHGFGFMRGGKKVQLASGRPRLPKSYEPYLLDRVVDASVIAVGSSTIVSTTGYNAGERETTVVIDAGRREGLLPEMELKLRGDLSGEAIVARTRDDDSDAILTSTVTPRVGWKLSTRYDWKREFAPPDQPYRVTATRTGGPRLKPYKDRLGWLTGDASVSEARESGFTVRVLGRVEIAAVDRHLMGYEPLSDKIDEALKPWGANVYEEEGEQRRGLPGPWTTAQTFVAYRIEFEGRPVDSLDLTLGFLGSDDRHGWERTRAVIRLKRTEYSREQSRLYDVTTRELLHLTQSQSDGWAALMVEDLGDEQRAAIKKHSGLASASGRVVDALHAEGSKWTETLSAEVESRLKPLRESDPKAYLEYKELREKAYPKR